MTREEFITRYAQRSGVDPAWIMEVCDAFPCDCGEDGCPGWQMVTKEHLKTLKRLESEPNRRDA